jgi:hypothetical protein
MQEYDRDGDALDAPLMGRPGGRGLFPGEVEVEIGGRTLGVANESPRFGEDAASGLATRVSLRAFDDDLELPAFSADHPGDKAEEMIPFLVRALGEAISRRTSGRCCSTSTTRGIARFATFRSSSHACSAATAW